ncbi:MAG: M3 family oligoendopeptidase [Bacteroidota bacterium]
MTTQLSIPFSDFVYERPDLEKMGAEFNNSLQAFKKADSLKEASTALESMDAIRAELMTAYNICHIRYTINTKDEFYRVEHDWFDENSPKTEAWRSDYYSALVDSPFRPQLEKRFGDQLFRVAELSIKTFKPEILPLLQEENKISSEYTKMKAGAAIEFEGETYNLSSILAKELDPDRELRKRANEAKWAWYAQRVDKIDEIFDSLVKTRTSAAKKLGYETFIGLGYARMLRTDYDPERVASFRKGIRDHFVPLAMKMYERQKQRLGIDELHYYDENFRFPEGNPKPQGKPEWIIDQARDMYEKLAPETGDFFRILQDRDLMDLVAKEGKATGGYCTFLPDYGLPYIFSNFNGTSGDIDVLTHEFGHAFQVYSSRHQRPNEYNWPTYEACEIHSMSMEFFTYPWMKNFFGPDTDKYFYSHLSGSVRFLPYGVAIDEFQHRIYAQPDLTGSERRAIWRELEGVYLPQRNYDSNSYLNSGGYWQRQSHVFSAPFYYIDYCLAQICAFQFWLMNEEDHEKAWSNYLTLCKAGGSGSFLELVELAGLESPFDEGVIERIAKAVGDRLESM